MKNPYPVMPMAAIFVFCMTTLISGMVDARGLGGGGGFSRGGPAAGGGFSSRSAARQPAFHRDRNPGNRQERRDEIREDRQQHRNDAREDRQDYLDDEWDDNNHYYGGVGVVTGVALGSAASSDYVTSAPCSTTEVVNGSTYYHCGSNWYKRGYEGGEVVYIIVPPPAGR